MLTAVLAQVARAAAVVPAATLTACPEAALARVTVGQTVQAAGSVRSTLSAVSKSGRLTVDQRYGTAAPCARR